jgi:hypothetical protein
MPISSRTVDKLGSLAARPNVLSHFVYEDNSDGWINRRRIFSKYSVVVKALYWKPVRTLIGKQTMLILFSLDFFISSSRLLYCAWSHAKNSSNISSSSPFSGHPTLWRHVTRVADSDEQNLMVCTCRMQMVLTMAYNTQNHWGYGPYPLSGIRSY